MPVVAMQAATFSAWKSNWTPSASSTSAPPTDPDIARLPCFATASPAPAAISAAAVEMLNVCRMSPPVPQVSTTARATRTGVACRRIARAAPTISSTRSPFMRSATRKPAICASDASPSMIARTTASTPSSGRSRRAMSSAMAVRMSIEEFHTEERSNGDLGDEQRSPLLRVSV